MDKKQAFLEFLESQRVLSFCVLEQKENIDSIKENFLPYCASCFYVFNKLDSSLLIKSSKDSRHIKAALINPNVFINIFLDSSNLMNLQGAQILSFFTPATKEQKNIYYSKFPFARLGEGEIYALKIKQAKYTNNAFNKKEIFNEIDLENLN